MTLPAYGPNGTLVTPFAVDPWNDALGPLSVTVNFSAPGPRSPAWWAAAQSEESSVYGLDPNTVPVVQSDVQIAVKRSPGFPWNGVMPPQLTRAVWAS